MARRTLTTKKQSKSLSNTNRNNIPNQKKNQTLIGSIMIQLVNSKLVQLDRKIVKSMEVRKKRRKKIRIGNTVTLLGNSRRALLAKNVHLMEKMVARSHWKKNRKFSLKSAHQDIFAQKMEKRTAGGRKLKSQFVTVIGTWSMMATYVQAQNFKQSARICAVVQPPNTADGHPSSHRLIWKTTIRRECS